ncbi:8-oxo-dGTP diphosphatase MutT [Winogradskyella thalassocola]|uniref:8-oxo-dGTP diphosphatase n=1 Tax=Winogradskyella thalassocola TaxID=262004 RepID=A0A1G7ZPD3_9FLAO|nr:8-oxo-dGTP diphosphatase MutT [Winogradskyella thalassocola]SDH10406.1 8-oxo-dGTP diphosphatase [Winogradskyella thalassocola]
MPQNLKSILVAAAIIQKDNKIFIARRSPHKHLGGLWEFPGGKIEEGETDEECLYRELQEELGITINVKEFFMNNIHNYGNITINLKAYFCEIKSGEITLSDHDQYLWVLKNELDNYEFAPADLPFIKVMNAN